MRDAKLSGIFPSLYLATISPLLAVSSPSDSRAALTSSDSSRPTCSFTIRSSSGRENPSSEVKSSEYPFSPSFRQGWWCSRACRLALALLGSSGRQRAGRSRRYSATAEVEAARDSPVTRTHPSELARTALSEAAHSTSSTRAGDSRVPWRSSPTDSHSRTSQTETESGDSTRSLKLPWGSGKVDIQLIQSVKQQCVQIFRPPKARIFGKKYEKKRQPKM